MHLTLYTDYALRTLLYLGSRPDTVAPVSEISAAYGISLHHVAKVAKLLSSTGLVNARRGKSGGLTLGRAPESIRVGEVVRLTEPHLNILECFEPSTNTCPLIGICALQSTLVEARRAFLDVLDRTTVADLLHNHTQLASVLNPRLPVMATAGRARRARSPTHAA